MNYVIMPINSNPRKYFPKILIDQNHQQAWATTLEIASRVNPVNPADSSYEKAIKTAYSLGYEVAVNFADEIRRGEDVVHQDEALREPGLQPADDKTACELRQERVRVRLRVLLERGEKLFN